MSSVPSLTPELNVDQKKISSNLKQSTGFTLADDRSPQFALELLTTDHKRFQSYRNYAKNQYIDAAAEVHSKITMERTALKQWIEQRLECTLTNSDSITKSEMLDVVIVAQTIKDIGSKKLAEIYDSGAMANLQNIAIRPYELRSHNQQKYRNESKSKFKEEKHTAHFIGVDVILQLNTQLDPEDRVRVEALKEIVNMPKNMRMVLEKTNLQLHKEVDAALLRESGDPAELTVEQLDRIRQIAKVVQSNEMQKAFIDAGAEKIYAKVRDTLSKHDRPGYAKIWDKRRDQATLRSSKDTQLPCNSGGVPLKKDGTPDRRFKMNRTNLQLSTSAPIAVMTPASASSSVSHLKRDGTPDMRYKENRTPESTVTLPPAPVHLKRDGTPDLRYRENRMTSPQSTTASYSSSNYTNSGGSGRTLYTGPRGGTYYINSSGNKAYV